MGNIKAGWGKSIGTNKAASVPCMRQRGAKPQRTRVCGEPAHRTVSAPNIFKPNNAPSTCILEISNGAHLHSGAFVRIRTISEHALTVAVSVKRRSQTRMRAGCRALE
jgi:hypothetical protein